MALIYLSLGSNIDRTLRICAALDALAENFGDLTLSSVYESDSVGFKGDNFYNLVVAIKSEMSVGEISFILKEIENSNGRDRSAPTASAAPSRTPAGCAARASPRKSPCSSTFPR